MISLDGDRPNMKISIGGSFGIGFILAFLSFPLGRSEGMQNRKTGKATLKRGRSWGHIGILQLHCDSVWELLGAVAEVLLCEYHEFCLLISLLSCVPEWGLLHISLFL